MSDEKILAVDFDGTIVKHEYPRIGPPVPNAISYLREYQDKGWKLILWTMRSGEPLAEAVEYLKFHGIKLFGVNNNPGQASWTSSPKVYANYYIDDAAVGCPLLAGDHARPYVDWHRIDKLIN